MLVVFSRQNRMTLDAIRPTQKLCTYHAEADVEMQMLKLSPSGSHSNVQLSHEIT